MAGPKPEIKEEGVFLLEFISSDKYYKRQLILSGMPEIMLTKIIIMFLTNIWLVFLKQIYGWYIVKNICCFEKYMA